MTRPLALILCVALVLVGLSVGVARADDQPWLPVVAEPFDGTVPDGRVVVFVHADNQDLHGGAPPPEGLEWGLGRQLPDGFSDGGDVPEGFVAVLAQRPGPAFWRFGIVPQGLLAVLAWPAPDGFSDGGDRMDRWVPVLFRSVDLRGPGP
jgi:hypothetical protein